MALLDELPAAVIRLMESAVMSEFATVSSAGVPIDTPMLYFPSEDLSSLDVATGLAYPIKAERARKNPRVGITVEGRQDEPVVAIAGFAAVCDANLQENADRYIAETTYALVGGVSWEVARNAVWYWTRMIVKVTPARVYWWDSPSDMDRTPHQWNAAPGTIFPSSDPASPGEPSKPAKWKQRSWQDLAGQALARSAPAHLTLCDADGFPIPILVRAVDVGNDGFRLLVPKGAPWILEGKASLTFEGLETFIGDVLATDEFVEFRVDRALPVHPQMENPVSQWYPTDENREILMGRLIHETARRGQSIPVIPERLPTPTAGALLRIDRIRETSNSEVHSTAEGSPLSNLAELLSGT